MLAQFWFKVVFSRRSAVWKMWSGFSFVTASWLRRLSETLRNVMGTLSVALLLPFTVFQGF